MKYSHFLSIFALSTSIMGCAIAPGLQTHDIPTQGDYTTELGTKVSVVSISQDTIATTQHIQNIHQQNYDILFNRKNQLYRLNAGDVLSVQFWAYPEISTPASTPENGYRINQTGYIQLPLIGQYRATGKTLSQINRELRDQFARYLKNPDVIVRVLSYEGQRYSIQGSVMKAGQFFLSDQPVSLYAALGAAGGISALGDNTYIQLIRQGITYDLNTIQLEKKGYSLHELLIQNNDTIYVGNKENQKIYVMGESGKNQALPMRDQGMTLSDALGESLGLNPNSASASRIYILRTDLENHSTDLYHLNLANIADFSLANQFKLRSNDIIYVDATGLTRWQRIVNQIVPFSNAIYSFDRLGK